MLQLSVVRDGTQKEHDLYSRSSDGENQTDQVDQQQERRQ
jgi:hypothetical protein